MLKRATLIKTNLRRFSALQPLKSVTASDLTFDYKQDENINDTNGNDHNSNKTVHPLSALGTKLIQELKEKKDISEIYTEFNNEILNFKKGSNGESRLQKSYGLNSFISRLIQSSIVSDNHYKVDPYEILNNVCDSQLARAVHFEIVMEYFLKNKAPEDVMSLWIKYLSLVTENPNIATTKSVWNPHRNIVALTTIAYLLLPNNIPNLEVLNQILQVNETNNMANSRTPYNNSIPIKFLAPMIHQKVNKEFQRTALKNLDALFIQYISKNNGWLKTELDETFDTKTLQFYYSSLKNSIDVVPNDEIDALTIVGFMDKFVSLRRPDVAIQIYNDFKPVFKENPKGMLLLNDSLLVVVAELPAHTKLYKLLRIQAIWNSLIASNETISANSYIKLFRGLVISRNLEELENIWENEVSNQLKKDKSVIEAYLNSILRLKKSLSLSDVHDKLPKDLENIELINVVLLKTVQQNNFNIDLFNKAYTEYFSATKSKDNETRLLPDVETLAIKMLANYSSSSDKQNFNFLQNIGVNQKSNFNKLLKISENFISISSSIEPIRAFFVQIKEPVNSKKYKLFISAEFMKSDGSYKEAEALFKEYLDKSELNTNDKSALRAQFLRELLESLVGGFCHISVRSHNLQYIGKIDEYYRLISEINVSVSKSTLSTMLHTYSILANVAKGTLKPVESQYINNFLDNLDKLDFKANQGDIRNLKSKGLDVPQSLIKMKPSKSGSIKIPPASTETKDGSEITIEQTV